MSLDAAFAAYRAGRNDEALKALRGLGVAAADDPIALQLWSVLTPPEQRAESRALLERAVRIAPQDAGAHYNLAVTLQAQGDLERAVLAYQQALALQPDHLGALNNLSDLLRRRGRAEEGWALLQRYLTAGGPVDGLEIRFAKLALDTRRFDESETWFRAAAVHAPADASVLWEHAMLTLLRGDWALGWLQYEARLLVHGLANLGAFRHAAPVWRREPIAGKRLLLHREQGLGDMMMFASALPALLEEDGEVHLALPPSLVRLFAESFPKAQVWSSITAVGASVQPPQPYLQAVGPLDYQAPICSLGALRMAGGPPAPARYLRAPKTDVALWADRLDVLAPKRPGVRRIGLVIGARRPSFSDDGMTNGLRKSIPPAELARLAGVADVQWVALHDRESAPMLADIPELRFVDTSPWLTDMADTAAVIENLDLVVSVDTAVAHLAGALGKPLKLLLWRCADWRWGADRVDSAWYPDVTTYRQDKAGDWGPPLDRLAADLRSARARPRVGRSPR